MIQCAAGFLMSTQAAVFAPSKYGMLPEILPEKRLSWGNGVLELGTFMAIILGTIAAGIFASIFPGREYASGFVLLGPRASRPCHEPRDLPRARRQTGRAIPLESAGRPVHPDRRNPQRPRAFARGDRKCVFLVSGLAAADQRGALRHRRAARIRGGREPPAGRVLAWNRIGKLPGRLSFRGQNRIWTGSAGRHRNHNHHGAAGPHGTFRHIRCRPPGVAGILRRIFRGAHQRADSAPSAAGPQRAA